jgi:hypothetical protein
MAPTPQINAILTQSRKCLCKLLLSVTLIYFFVAVTDPVGILAQECYTIVKQSVHIGPVQEAIQKRDGLQRELNALDGVDVNFKEFARVGKALKTAATAVKQLPPSEEDYRTLATRRAALMQTIEDKCLELADAEDYDTVVFVGGLLEKLQAIVDPILASGVVARSKHSEGTNTFAQPLSPLLGECDAVIAWFAHVPALKDALIQKDTLQREFEALKATKKFIELGRVGKLLKEATAAIVQFKECLTLADRCASLISKVTETCRALADAEDYDALDTLASKLTLLKAENLCSLPRYCSGTGFDPFRPAAAVDPSMFATLLDACDLHITQCAAVARLKISIKQRDALQRQFDALKAAKNFVAMGMKGKELKAAVADVAQLPLSEEDYLALPARHAELLQKVPKACTELADAGAFDKLNDLALKLVLLKALDVPTAVPDAEDDGENDPVYVAPATTTSAIAAGEEEDWLNDPVYVEP